MYELSRFHTLSLPHVLKQAWSTRWRNHINNDGERLEEFKLFYSHFSLFLSLDNLLFRDRSRTIEFHKSDLTCDFSWNLPCWVTYGARRILETAFFTAFFGGVDLRGLAETCF